MDVKHSILVTTYQQEEYIGECLASIFSQSVMPYEVIVADDCSKDRTWDIIQSYVDKYPDIIKAYRNENNLGVFGNYNKLIRQATGDFVNIVAGDDLLPAGVLEAYNRFIGQNALDCEVPFIIYTNSHVLMLDGRIKTYYNYRMKDMDPLFLTLMCEFYVWDTGLSKGLVDQMPNIVEGIGYQADWLQHVQRVLCCKNHYFIDEVGYIYRHSVGVTVNENAQRQYDSMLKVIEIYNKSYPQLLTPKVRVFFSFLQAYFNYLKAPTPRKYFKMVFSRIRTGKLSPDNSFSHNWKILLPRKIVKLAKAILGKK